MPGKCSALARVESSDQLEALRSLVAGLCPTAPTMSDEWEQCFAAGPGQSELRACCQLHGGQPDEMSWRLLHTAAVTGRANSATAAGGAGAVPVLPLSTVESAVVGPIREFMDGLGYSMTKEYVRRRLDFVKPPTSATAPGKLALPVHVTHFEIFALTQPNTPASRDPRQPDAPPSVKVSEFGWLEVYAEVEDITNAGELAATKEQVQQLASLFSGTSLQVRHSPLFSCHFFLSFPCVFLRFFLSISLIFWTV